MSRAARFLDGVNTSAVEAGLIDPAQWKCELGVGGLRLGLGLGLGGGRGGVAPPVGLTVTVSGTTEMESTLTMTVGGGTPDEVKWQSAPWNSGAPTVWTDISGETASTLLLKAAQKWLSTRGAARKGATWYYSDATSFVSAFYSFTGFTSGAIQNPNPPGAIVIGANSTVKGQFTINASSQGSINTSGLALTTSAFQVEDLVDFGGLDQEVEFTFLSNAVSQPRGVMRIEGVDGGPFIAIRATPTTSTLTIEYINSAGAGSSSTILSVGNTAFASPNGKRGKIKVLEDRLYFLCETAVGSGVFTEAISGGTALPASSGGINRPVGTKCGVSAPNASGTILYDNPRFRPLFPPPNFTPGPLRLGMNETWLADSHLYIADYLRDRGKKCTLKGLLGGVERAILNRDAEDITNSTNINTNATGTGTGLGANTQGFFQMEWDGTLKPVHSTTCTRVRIQLPASFSEFGQYDVQVAPPSTALANVTFTAGTSGSQTQVTSYDSATGKLRINVVSNVNGGIGARIDFDIDSSWSAGINPTIYLVSETSPVSVCSGSFYNFANGLFQLYRCMTPRKINSDDIPSLRTETALPVRTAAMRWTGRMGGATVGSRMSIETQVAICNEKQSALHYNCSHLDGEDFIQEEADYIRDNLWSAAAVYPEHSNELGWNSQFGQANDARLAGCRAGYAPSGITTHAAATPQTIYDGSPSVNFFAGTGTVTATLVAGRRYMANLPNGRGWQVFDVLTDIPVGAQISVQNTEGGAGTGSTGGTYTLVYNSVSTTRAYQRWHGYRTMRLGQIFATSFASTGRGNLIPVLGGQAAAGLSSVQSGLEFDSVKTVVKRVAYAEYWGATLLTFADATFGTSWDETDKAAVYHSDYPSALNAMFSVMNGAITTQILSARTNAEALGDWNLANGLGVDDIKTMRYEFNWHAQASPNGQLSMWTQFWPGQAAVNAAWVSSGTAFPDKSFVKGSTGTVYRNTSGSTIAGTVDPTTGGGWVAYTDPLGQLWNSTFVATINSEATTQGMEHASYLLKLCMEDSRFGDAQTFSFDSMETSPGNEVVLFDRLSAFGGRQNWGYGASENDYASTNYRRKAVVDKVASL